MQSDIADRVNSGSQDFPDPPDSSPQWICDPPDFSPQRINVLTIDSQFEKTNFSSYSGEALENGFEDGYDETDGGTVVFQLAFSIQYLFY